MNTTWRREIIPLTVIAAMFAAAAWSWRQVPERIPIHWNAAGQADGYGGKFVGLLLIPLITLGMYGLFFALPLLDPGRRNYANFAGAYLAIRTAMILFFAVLYGGALLAAHGRPVNMTSIILPAMGVMFIVIGNVMGKIRPNFFVGIRTPWTLCSKQSWNKTHRLGGWMFMAFGLVFILAAFGSPVLLLPLVIGSSLAMVCVLLPYSFYMYQRDPDRITPAGVIPATDDPLAGEGPHNAAASKGDSR
jgi:uncharacterized membrane protein